MLREGMREFQVFHCSREAALGTNNSNTTSEVKDSELSVTTQTENEQVLIGCSQAISDQRTTAAQLCQQTAGHARGGSPVPSGETLCLPLIKLQFTSTRGAYVILVPNLNGNTTKLQKGNCPEQRNPNLVLSQ